MNRVAKRSTIALLLALVLVVGMILFSGEYLLKADDWAVFPGSPQVYTGSNIGCGVITDREGVLLLDATGKRVYADDLELRLATLHWLGDRSGYISAPAVTYYSQDMAGYDLVNGLYSYSGTGGEATMTLSAELQTLALEALDGRKGTVGVYNYETGEILCAVSSPSYDPDNVPDIQGDTSGKYDGVYLNRFTQVTYVPGSIFKVITAAAALEEDPDNANLRFTCSAAYNIQGDNVTCDRAHGEMDMSEALARSCNCWFAQLVEHLGGDTLKDYVDEFGVTQSQSFDGITTAEGHYDISDAVRYEIAWSGIGQYTDLVNPCRFMTLMGAIAGGGEAAEPYVVNRVSSGMAVGYRAGKTSTGRLFSRETAKTLQKMMRGKVEMIYGTGNFPKGLTVCAKSGTAQLDGELPNATFAGFVTDDEYPLAFVVMVENAGGGSDVCVPIISRVLEGCMEVLDNES